MELSKFRKLMKAKFGADLKEIFVNIEKKTDQECMQSEIAWKDCPILVKESGFKSSQPVIKFIARKNFNRGWDHKIYVTGLNFIIPIDNSHMPYLISNYATGNITRMPIEPWRGSVVHYGRNVGDLTNDEVFKTSLEGSVVEWDAQFKKILNYAFIWNKITSDPEIKERREKIMAIRKQVAALNKQTSALRRESYEKYVNDEMRDYAESLTLQGLKRIDIKISGNSGYLADRRCKSQINANNLNSPA